MLDRISHRALIESREKLWRVAGNGSTRRSSKNLTDLSGPQPSLRLTGRETEIADLVSRGLRNKTISDRLHLSEGTVKMRLHHVYAKLHLRSRAELAWARRIPRRRPPRIQTYSNHPLACVDTVLSAGEAALIALSDALIAACGSYVSEEYISFQSGWPFIKAIEARMDPPVSSAEQ